jgi:hypothetical protein
MRAEEGRCGSYTPRPVGGSRITKKIESASLRTPWSEAVSSECPHPGYPRPQLVRPDWLSLNGLWDYSIAPRGADAPASFDGKILVPLSPRIESLRGRTPPAPAAASVVQARGARTRRMARTAGAAPLRRHRLGGRGTQWGGHRNLSISPGPRFVLVLALVRFGWSCWGVTEWLARASPARAPAR